MGGAYLWLSVGMLLLAGCTRALPVVPLPCVAPRAAVTLHHTWSLVPAILGIGSIRLEVFFPPVAALPQHLICPGRKETEIP
jgi:hypothetical protein